MRSPSWTRLYKLTRDPILKAWVSFLPRFITNPRMCTHFYTARPTICHTRRTTSRSPRPSDTRKSAASRLNTRDRLNFWRTFLSNEAYLLSDIRRQISRASCRSCEELLTRGPRRESGNIRPVFTTIYHPLTGQIGDILRKHWCILQSKPDLHQVVPL